MTDEQTVKKKSKLTPGNIAYSVLILLLVVLVLYLVFARLTGKVPTFFGYSVVRIVTPSMDPKIPVGSFVLIKRISPEEVEVGDIITFYTDDPDPLVAGKTITHRVLSISENNGQYVFQTKGDNTATNPVPDAYPARGERLVGRYVAGMLPVTAVVTLFREHLPVAILMLLAIPAIVYTRITIRKALKKNEQREEYIKRKVAEELARLQAAGAAPPIENQPKTDPKDKTERENDDV